ncbi:MAG: response regulator transcription factor [Bryobacteraceae bacterium]|nr:response regulator transcription factor [Bryobacteraceae bacterium]
MMADRPRLLLADDHMLVLEGIRALLETKYAVVGAAQDGQALVRAVEQLQPDIVLMDISLPILNGIEATRRIRQITFKTKVIFVTMHSDATFVHEAIRAGASGYVLKRGAAAELTAAIDDVCKGRIYITPLVTENFVRSMATRNTESGENFGRLTTRQREVLQLVAEGKAVKEIASSLGIAPKTVEFHKTAIMRSLSLFTTADLTKYAVKHGMVAL